MKINLIEIDEKKCECLRNIFEYIEGIEIVNDDIIDFLQNNKDVDCVVSPANSFGLMDGGFDLALTLYYGSQLQKRVQEYIIKNYYGEQPVGSSFIIPTNINDQYLIHTPTMRVPSKIKDKTVIYQCMRSTLITAYKHNIKNIVIPLFGGATGEVKAKDAALMMRLAFEQLQNVPQKIDWEYASKIKVK